MKKMRRLIPAIAMLLVSAVMLSTASFAWFTMNDEVKVEGMSVQAQASGSLLISQSPLTASSGTAGVIISTGVKNMAPMAFNSTSLDSATLKTADDENAGWYAPESNMVSDITTGINNGDFAKLDTPVYYQEEFYVATAGDPETRDLTVTLTCPVFPTGESHNAYAAAIYVIEKADGDAWKDYAKDATTGVVVGDVDAHEIPDVILYVEQGKNYITFEDVAIPSVSGAAAGTEVGLKFIVRFYVDGALMPADPNKGVDVNAGLKYTDVAGTEYDADIAYYEATLSDPITPVADGNEGLIVDTILPANYYTLVDGKYVPATGKVLAGTTYYTITGATPAIAGDDVLTSGEVPEGWFTSEPHTVKSAYTYIRSADIPAYGSSLALSFKLEPQGN